MTHLIIPVSEKDHFQGSLQASISLVEYGDYQCESCKLANPILKQLQHELESQLCLIFRHFPLKQAHPSALIAAQTAEAAYLQNKFWEMHHLLYAHQADFNPDLWIQLAEDLKLDLTKFKEDIESPSTLKKIEEDFMGGVRSGVNGTPCFFINGERYDGDLSYDTFKQALLQAAQTKL